MYILYTRSYSANQAYVFLCNIYIELYYTLQQYSIVLSKRCIGIHVRDSHYTRIEYRVWSIALCKRSPRQISFIIYKYIKYSVPSTF